MLTLRRDTSTHDAILGTLHVGDKKLHTIERPWIPHPSGGPAGAPFVSCVPAGVYRIEPFKHPSGEKSYVLSNPAAGVYKLPFEIPKPQRDQLRSRITIRAANYAFEAVDAIGIGVERTKTSVGWKVDRSLDGMNILRTMIDRALDLTLVIEEGGSSSV